MTLSDTSIEAAGPLNEVTSFIEGPSWRAIAFQSIERVALPHVPIFANAGSTEALLQALTTASRLSSLDLSDTKLGNSHVSHLLRALCTSVTQLNISGNEFQYLPTSFVALRKLKTLNLSSGKLEYVPGALATMQCELVLFPSPNLSDPPLDVQKKGSRAIKDFLSASGHWWNPRQVSIAVLGHSEAGKTSLVKALSAFVSHRQQMPRGVASQKQAPMSAQQVLNLQSTVGVLEQKWTYRTDEALHAAALLSGESNRGSEIHFNVLDFAGQLEYLTTHKYFLPVVDAIYLLVTDVTQTAEKQRSQFKHWLALLESRLDATILNSTDCNTTGFVKARYAVMLVGTKTDLTTVSREQLRRGCDELVSLLRERFTSPSRTVYLVSSVDGAGLAELFNAITEFGETFTAASRMTLPRLTGQLYALLQAHASSALVMTTADLQQLLANERARGSRGTAMSEFLFTRSLLELASRGIILYERDSDQVWLSPSTVSQVLALFICPLSHRLRYFNQLTRPLFGGAFVSAEDALKRIRTLDRFQKVSMEEGLCLLRSLQQLDICIELGPEAKQIFGAEGFLFPSLRAPGQLFLVHPTFIEDAQQGRRQAVTVNSRNAASYSNYHYLARAYAFRHETAAVEIYLRLQVILKHLLDLRYKVYMNSMLLCDQQRNRALANLQDGRINVVICGANPRALSTIVDNAMRQAAKRVQQTFKVTVLCPYCAQGIALHRQLDANGRCEMGHSVSLQVLLDPVPASVSYAFINDIWAPRDSQMTNIGEWRVKGALRWTQLAHETNRSREIEFLRAKDLFYKFSGRDKLANYELDRVVLLQNEELEWSFVANLMSLIDHHMKLSTPEETVLLGSEDDLRWRNWVLQQFNSYVCRLTTSNANLNLVAGWHGTSEETCFKIAENNFREPSEVVNQTDPGYFGKGIYFTQFPSYSAKYSGTTQCILLSWVTMGRIYPIIESPFDKINFLGKGCQPGFDSHYAVVKKMNETSYFPCKPIDTPEYDELVVFKKAQVLPRYIFYYRKTLPQAQQPQQATTTTATSSVPPILVIADDLKPLNILWVDDKPFGEHVHLTLAWSKQFPNIFYKTLSSTQELRVWMSHRAGAITRRGDVSIRIITNRYRERDGGVDAAELLVRWVRNESPLPRTPILVYCSSTKELGHLQDRLTIITANIGFCQMFATSFADPCAQERSYA